MDKDAPSTRWRETKTDDEDARFERHAALLVGLQRESAPSSALARALHAKAHVGVEASFVVLDDLPAHARHGLFATPGTYRAWVRWSNGAPRRQKDHVPDARGIAIKVVGVAGRKLIPGLEDATTQDFLAIRTPALPFRDADEFMTFVAAARKPATMPLKLALAHGPLRALAIVRTLLRSTRRRDTSLATVPFFSGAAIACGPHAVRFAIVPVDPGPEPAVDGPLDGDHYTRDLLQRLRDGGLEYEMRLQFFRDEATTPIEDHTVEWRESDAPFVPVARISIPQQDPESEQGKALSQRIEGFSFDPWHALVEHRPLGNVMRARNKAYRASTQARGA
ncbi:MAG TPA: hypothetical protein VFG69_05920, partial [Nannocystaceae bacterium]|nr:hypothetical protein [Nannocystaceae bacterium]